MLLALIFGVGVWELRPHPDAAQVMHFSFGPPVGDSLEFRLGWTPLAISRDSSNVVFLARHGGTPRLFVRRMDRLESEPLAGTDNADDPFFSPDGKWVGFFADGKLKKVSILGGTPVTLCDAPNPNGGTWAPDDSIIFAPGDVTGLKRVPAEGGTPQPFTRPDSRQGEKGQIWPQVLPGGKAVIYASRSGGLYWDWTIAVAALQTGEVKILPLQGSYPRYSPAGYLAFERAEGLFAVPFDVQRLEVKGSPFPVSQVRSYAVSETDTLVYVPGGASTLAWVDRKGIVTPLGAPLRNYYPRLCLSPDGKRVVVVILGESWFDVWVYDIPHGALTRLTFGEGDNLTPTWSPDGRRIAFSRFRTGSNTIVAKATDGSGPEETLLPAQTSGLGVASWSPDGKFLACSKRIGRNGKWEIWVLPLEGERKPELLLANQFDNRGPAFSPDGKYLAYISNETGHNEVYVILFGNGTGKWQISTGGGNVADSAPVWERDGKQLFYRESGSIMGVDVKTQHVFTASIPRVIVPAKAIGNLASGLNGFDVSPDGQRFLIHQQSSEAAQTQINVVLNWSEELRRRSASGKN